ncbi:hypothetical protein [Paenibacillus sp. O199]|uniref:hypothetical protein n=1 Tax=Paenibacillus sp. O199 TaxID=1643925 RepID=UPI0007BEC03E|nr:hypothetical protein [Paenibacillus sp. O199]
MLEKVNFVLELSSLEKEINELKLSVMGDNLMKHRISEEGIYTIIYMENNNQIADEKFIFYGRKMFEKLYIARMQHIMPIEVDEPDFYKEFFSTGEELVFA